MAIVDVGAGQETHVFQLDKLVKRIKQLEDERDSLQARLDGVLSCITDAEDKAFPETKKCEATRP